MTDKERREHMLWMFRNNDSHRVMMDRELGEMMGVSRRTAARDVSILKTEGRIDTKLTRFKTANGWYNLRTITVRGQ